MITLRALCRLDDELIERIRAGTDVGGVVRASLCSILAAASAYGAAFGLWRAPEQAVYAAIKLPLVIFLVAGSTALLSAILAAILRSRLSMQQCVVCILLSLAIASIVLGALAPVSAFLVINATPPDPVALGLALDDPLVRPSLRVSRALLLWNVVAIACAGISGVLRLRNLLTRLVEDHGIANRLLVSWLAAQLAVGSQLSWILRPFLGKPHLPVRFVVDDWSRGNFFDEVAASMAITFGPAALPVATVAAVCLIVGLAWSMRPRPTIVEVTVHEWALVVANSRRIPWARVAAVRVDRVRLVIELAVDHSLVREELTVVCVDGREAHELARRIEERRLPGAPFRIAGA